MEADNNEENGLKGSRGFFYYGGIFVISCAIIVFEVCLLRIFSVLFLHHYAFVIVSVALLGLGLGGIVVHVGEKARMFKLAPFTSFAYLSNAVSLLLILFMMLITLKPELNVIVVVIFLLLPFIMGGMVISRAFEQFPGNSNRIYFYNLIGSALGAVVVMFAMNSFGGVNLIALISVFASLAGLMFAACGGSTKKMILPAILFIAFLINLFICIANPYLPDIPIDKNKHKEIYNIKKERDADLNIVETRWSSYGRTDLVEFSDNPVDKTIFTDGTAGTPMYLFDGNLDKLFRRTIYYLKYYFIESFPFRFLTADEKDNVLIIGAGGGRDALVALLRDVKRIVAVDVNPETIALVKDYASYNGGIYTDFENVEALAEEGRSYLRSTDEKFDLIMLPLAVTKTSRSLEGYTLTENYLYTMDSVRDYLSHLTDEGRLVLLLHSRGETYRLLSIVLSVFEKKGLSVREAMKHIYVVGKEKRPLIIIKKTAFTAKEMYLRHAMAHKFKLFEEDQKKHFVFFPFLGTGSDLTEADISEETIAAGMDMKKLKNCDKMDGWLNVLYSGRVSIDGWLERIKFDRKPVTDNRPFFSNYSGRLPRELILMLKISGIILLLSIFGPPVFFALRENEQSEHDGGRGVVKQSLLKRIINAEKHFISISWRYILTFLVLGAGFMMIEITFIQKFILFLGQPALSLSILLLSLFIGMGVGGLLTKKFLKLNKKAEISVGVVLIISIAGAYIMLLPVIFDKCLGYPLQAKMLISICLIVPLGGALGIPFPSALQLIKQNSKEEIIPWMWGINGVSSVVGSVLAMILAVMFGFNKVLLTGVLMYASILLFW